MVFKSSVLNQIERKPEIFQNLIPKAFQDIITVLLSFSQQNPHILANPQSSGKYVGSHMVYYYEITVNALISFLPSNKKKRTINVMNN